MFRKWFVPIFLLAVIALNRNVADSETLAYYAMADLHNDIFIKLLQERSYLTQNEPGQQISFETIKTGHCSLLTFAVWLPAYFFNEKAEKFEWMHGDGWDALNNYRFQKRNLLKHCFDAIKEVFADSENYILINTKKDLDFIEDDTKTGILLSIEGLHMVDNINDVRWLYDENSVRVFGLTWNEGNSFGHSHKEKGGLTEEGKKLVENIVKWGGVIDVSHSSEQVIYDVIEITEGKYPIVASHSGAKSICKVSRNLSDEAIRAIAKTGGVVGVGFARDFFKKNNGGREYSKTSFSIRDVVDTIDYIIKITSVDNVAIGSDYGFIVSPWGLENIGQVQTLAAELLSRGYSPESVKKIMEGNVLRVLRKILN